MQTFHVELFLQAFFACCLFVKGYQGTESNICDLLYSNAVDDDFQLSDETAKLMTRHLFPGYLPKAKLSAGFYTKLQGVEEWHTCVSRCCTEHDCDVVLFTRGTCYHIKCSVEPEDACQPVKSSHPRHIDTMMVVLHDFPKSHLLLGQLHPMFARISMGIIGSIFVSPGVIRPGEKQVVIGTPSSDVNSLNANKASMWVKIVSSWVSIILYLWTLVAPAFLSNRDFS